MDGHSIGCDIMNLLVQIFLSLRHVAWTITRVLHAEHVARDCAAVPSMAQCPAAPPARTLMRVVSRAAAGNAAPTPKPASSSSSGVRLVAAAIPVRFTRGREAEVCLITSSSGAGLVLPKARVNQSWALGWFLKLWAACPAEQGYFAQQLALALHMRVLLCGSVPASLSRAFLRLHGAYPKSGGTIKGVGHKASVLTPRHRARSKTSIAAQPVQQPAKLERKQAWWALSRRWLACMPPREVLPPSSCWT